MSRQFNAVPAKLELPASADHWMEQRGRELDWRLKRFSKRLMKNLLEGVSFDSNRLSITPVKAIISGEGVVLANQIDAMMPRIRITELLNEVTEHNQSADRRHMPE